jgi:hypothetical protein
MNRLTDAQWQQYQYQGFLRLGPVLSPDELKALQTRIDDIMLGKARVDYNKMLMQLDSDTGKYEDAGEQSKGHKGATLDYRKIQDLEFDPLFLQCMQQPLFEDICRREYGNIPVSCFRAMFMNKPANKGTFLPWHQDRWTAFDRDPKVTIWIALDPATQENGAVQIIPGSQHVLFNPAHESGFLSPEQAASIDKTKIQLMTLEPGEAVLLHNWTLHASDKNRSNQSRRAFSICYMDGNTRLTKTGEPANYPVIFGPGALSLDQITRQLPALSNA